MFGLRLGLVRQGKSSEGRHEADHDLRPLRAKSFTQYDPQKRVRSCINFLRFLGAVHNLDEFDDWTLMTCRVAD
jgi:hypothetical protein